MLVLPSELSVINFERGFGQIMDIFIDGSSYQIPSILEFICNILYCQYLINILKFKKSINFHVVTIEARIRLDFFPVKKMSFLDQCSRILLTHSPHTVTPTHTLNSQLLLYN